MYFLTHNWHSCRQYVREVSTHYLIGTLSGEENGHCEVHIHEYDIRIRGPHNLRHIKKRLQLGLKDLVIQIIIPSRLYTSTSVPID